jgi:hypothetical protein
MLVVVLAVDAEHVLEMPSAEDHDSVEAVRANRANPALGVGIRVGRLDWRAIKGGRFPHPAPPPSTAEDPVEGRADYVYVRG